MNNTIKILEDILTHKDYFSTTDGEDDDCATKVQAVNVCFIENKIRELKEQEKTSPHFWTNFSKQKRDKIINESKSQVLDYDDDTELCGYYENGAKYGIWLAVYDGGLEWTLDEHEFDEEKGVYIENSFDNVASLGWDTNEELGIKTPTNKELEEICKSKLLKMIKDYEKTTTHN